MPSNPNRRKPKDWKYPEEEGGFTNRPNTWTPSPDMKDMYDPYDQGWFGPAKSLSQPSLEDIFRKVLEDLEGMEGMDLEPPPWNEDMYPTYQRAAGLPDELGPLYDPQGVPRVGSNREFYPGLDDVDPYREHGWRPSDTPGPSMRGPVLEPTFDPGPNSQNFGPIGRDPSLPVGGGYDWSGQRRGPEFLPEENQWEPAWQDDPWHPEPTGDEDWGLRDMPPEAPMPDDYQWASGGPNPWAIGGGLTLTALLMALLNPEVGLAGTMMGGMDTSPFGRSQFSQPGGMPA